MALGITLVLSIVCCAVLASNIKSLDGTFTLTYTGSFTEYTPVGPYKTTYRGLWSRDEVGSVFLKTRETHKRLTPYHYMNDKVERDTEVEEDEFELYVRNGNSYSMYSGSKKSNTCKVKQVETLPQMDLSDFKKVGTENVIGRPAEKWLHRVPSRCSYRHNEYGTWWFAKLGEPQVEVPVKYEYYFSEACVSHQGYTTIDSWTVKSFSNDVDGKLFALPKSCMDLNS